MSEENNFQQKNGERFGAPEFKGAMLRTIHIVGLGLGTDNLGALALRIIEAADVLVGTAANLELFPQHQGGRINLDENPDAWLEAVAEAAREERVVVLSSGDPNYFGVAGRVVGRVGMENVRIHPNVTEVQAAFARLKESWDQVKVVNLEKDGKRALFAAVKDSSRVAVLADSFYTPQMIAELLLARGQKSWRMCVMENLGKQDSKISFFRLHELPSKEFSESRIIILLKKDDLSPLTLGVTAQDLGLSDTPASSPEIRAAFLSRLALEPGMTLWDLGNGASGLGLTATAILAAGKVIAVRNDPWDVEALENNRTKFGAANLDIRQGDLPFLLPNLPDPDRIFVDAPAPEAAEIIRLCLPRVPEGGIIAAWSRDLAGLESIRHIILGLDAAPESAKLMVSRGAMDWDEQSLESPRPVWLISGVGRKRPAGPGK
ncbi:MAG: precorrin-6y C5,15-methyltransferase (decarboxylating) subunit CbiE [Pseudomonadota bacterium]